MKQHHGNAERIHDKTFQTAPDWWRFVRQLNKDAIETRYLSV
jgi:hypothetical protein